MCRVRLATSFALLAVLLMGVTGCGTTVSQVSGTGDPQTDGALTAPQGGAGPAGAVDAVGNPSAAVGNPSAVVGGQGAAGSSGKVDGKKAQTVAGSAGRGPLEIGVYYPVNSTDTAAALDVTTASVSSEAAYRVAIDNVNAHGGLLGHKLVPVWATFDATNGQSMATQQQAACTTFTQDHHVFVALMTLAIYDEGLVRCLEKAGVLIWAMPGNGFLDRLQFQRYPHYVAAGALDLTRAASAYIEGLWTQGYFTHGAKLGLLYSDVPGVNRAIAESLKPALARHGLKLTATAGLSPAYTVAEIPASQISSAVLKFNTARVDHVLQFSVSGGVTMFVFMNNAESQGYRPRYGLSSLDGPALLTPNVPAAQLHGALATGWWPGLDVPRPAANAQAQSCDRLMTAHGQAHNRELCDQLNVLVAAASAGGAPLTAVSVIAGLSRVGAFPAGSVWSIKYGPGQRDGLAAATHVAFNDACGCFKYASSPYPLPT